MGKPGKTHAFLSPVWESMVKHTLSHPRVRETMVKHMLSHAQAVEIHSVSIGTSGILPGPHQHPSRITQMLKESDGFYAGFQIERDLFWMWQGWRHCVSPLVSPCVSIGVSTCLCCSASGDTTGVSTDWRRLETLSVKTSMEQRVSPLLSPRITP